MRIHFLVSTVLARFVVFLCFLSSCPTPAHSQPSGTVRPVNVLFLSTYGKHYPSTRELEAGLDDSLQYSQGRTNYFSEYLDEPQLPEADVSVHMAEHLASKYRSMPPDYIVAWAPSAYNFLREHPTLFPDSTHVYLETAQAGSLVIDADGNRKPALIEVRNDYDASLKDIQRLYQPSHLYVVAESGNRPADDRLQNFRQSMRRVLPSVPVDYLLDRNVADVLALTNGDADPHAAIYYLLQFTDGKETLSPFKVAERLATGSRHPVFSLWDSLLGSGMVGGPLFNHRTIGRAVGAALLAGKAKDSSLNVESTAFAYDDAAFRHWNLDTGKIPPGANVINRPQNLLYDYRYYLASVAIVIVMLSILSLRLSRSVRERDTALRELEHERATLAERVAERTQSLATTVNELNHKNTELQQHLAEIKTLQGIIPICSFCKKVRDDRGYWEMVEQYISQQTDAKFSHAVCPDCLKQHYDDCS